MGDKIYTEIDSKSNYSSKANVNTLFKKLSWSISIIVVGDKKLRIFIKMVIEKIFDLIERWYKVITNWVEHANVKMTMDWSKYATE